MKSEEKYREPDVTFGDAVALFAEIGVFPFVLLVGWQVKTYLKEAYWHSVSIVDALAWAGSSWAAKPDDWFGIHEILEFLPASPFVLIVSPIAGAIFGACVFYLTVGITKVFPSKQ